MKLTGSGAFEVPGVSNDYFHEKGVFQMEGTASYGELGRQSVDMVVDGTSGNVPASLLLRELWDRHDLDGRGASNEVSKELTSNSRLPDVELVAGTADKVRENQDSRPAGFAGVKEMEVVGREGCRAIVCGVEAQPGDTVTSIFRRLHPSLPEHRLAAEVKKMLKYNREHGNDLGDGDTLPAGKRVFLTSVRHYDDAGRITSVVKPDGSSLELSYGENGSLGRFLRKDPDGKVVGSGAHDPESGWIISDCGKTNPVKGVQVDRFGNLVIDINDSSRKVELANGTDLSIDVIHGKPARVEAQRGGNKVFSVDYLYDGQYAHVVTRYFDADGRSTDVRKLILLQELSLERPGFSLAPDGDDGLAEDLAESATRVAARMGTTGRCAEGVQIALSEVGLSEFLGCGHAFEMLGPLERSGKFSRVDASQARAGDVMIRQSSSGSYGHIAVITGRNADGSLLEASDHQAVVEMANPRYSQTVFLRPVR